MKDINALMDELELAAMAYERLGKLKRDDDKTRKMRIEAISNLSASRVRIIELFNSEKK